MSDSKIEWCTKTWNPVVGCTKASAGCANCWAIKTTWRLSHNPNPIISKNLQGLVALKQGYTTQLGPRVDERLDWTGEVRCLPQRLPIPSRWRLAQRIFVCSQADLFHPKVPDEFIDRVLDVIQMCPQHRFIVLTKRPDRMLRYSIDAAKHPGGRWPDNVWLGVSCEDQRAAERRIPVLLDVPAKHHWISAEPLIGPLDLREWLNPGSLWPKGLDWVVAGCESGANRRPDDVGWYTRLISQCGKARVPLFIKQAQGAGRVVKLPAFAGAVVWDEYPDGLMLPRDYPLARL